MRIVQTFLPRTKFCLILKKTPHVRTQRLEGEMKRKAILHTMVSGYSMWQTLMPLISSGERRPNWISLIVRKGALECSKINVMAAAVLFFYLDVAEPARN